MAALHFNDPARPRDRPCAQVQRVLQFPRQLVRLPRYSCYYLYLLCRRVASVILSSDKLSKRAKIVVRFIDLARLLRTQHNYSGLRCIIAGIRMAAPGDEPAPGVLAFPLTHMLRERNHDHEKILRSYETLLGSTQSHRAYRTALKHTDGPAIPEMCVFFSSLDDEG